MDRVDAPQVGADKAGIRSRAGKRFNRFEAGALGGDVCASKAGNGEDDPPRSIRFNALCIDNEKLDVMWAKFVQRCAGHALTQEIDKLGVVAALDRR
jgi:hypothetical protein